MTFAFRWQPPEHRGNERGGGGGVLPSSGKWQVAAPVVATLLPCCCLAAGLAPVATRQLRLTFVLVFLPLCASHLAVRCVSCAKRSEQRDREREREIEKILKYATKARWNFKLSRGLLIRPSGAGGVARHQLFPPSLLRIIKRSTARGKKLQARTAKLHANKLALHTLTLPLHPIMLHSVGS